MGVSDRRDPAAAERLMADVRMLASTIGERNVWHPEALASAAAHIRMSLAGAGYIPGVQTFDVHGRRVENIEAILRGQATAPDVVVVGAHYDSVIGSPGANDDGTGVAAVLELARRFAGAPQPRTIRFVLFVNEEPPFFQTEQMGSLVYARAARQRGDRIVAMLALETMGYYSDAPGSQEYPGGLAGMFPDRGNFIGLVANPESAALLREVHGAFSDATDFPVQAAAAPAEMPGVGWSDHWSFWQAGYPAVMVTDTAPYRYPWYHTSEDTPDKILPDRFAAVVDGLEHIVRALSREGVRPLEGPDPIS